MPGLVPNYVQTLGFEGKTVSYKWNNKVATDYIAKTDIPRLYHAIDASNFRAKMALGTCLAELIAWRFEGHTDIDDALLRIDAAWACVISPAYISNFKFRLTRGIQDTDPARGPLEVSLRQLDREYKRFSQGNIYLAEEIVNHAELAKYLAPDKKAFTEWFTETLRSLATTFPRGVDYDEDTELYDCTDEPPVPRQFFEPSYAYTPQKAKDDINDFLQGLDPSTNPYLATPEGMKAAGFPGIPYRL